MGLAVDIAPERGISGWCGREAGWLPVGCGPAYRQLRLGDEGGDDRVGQLDVAFIADVAQRGAGQTGVPDVEGDTPRRVYGVLDRAQGVQVGWLRRREVHPTVADVSLFVGDAVISAEDDMRSEEHTS